MGTTDLPRSQRVSFGETLVELAEQYPDMLVLDGDVANSTRTDILYHSHPDRFLELGIAEQNMVGVAAGLAAMGFVPWVCTFAAFIASRDLDQIRVVVAQPGLNVKFGAAYSGLLAGSTGKTHIEVEDLAIFRAMPGMTVIAPGDAVEVRAAMHAMMEDHGPIYLRLTRDAAAPLPATGHPFEIGRAYLLREGTDVTIISTGAQTARALEAAVLLAARAISALVLHVPTVKPLDTQAIVAAAEYTGLVVTAEEHSVIGGLGGAVAETLGEQRPTPMRRVGLGDVFAESAPNGPLLEKYGLTAAHVATAALELLSRTKR